MSVTFTNLAIFVLALTSYLTGFYAIFKNGYRPKLFTRIVFLFLSINSLASVIKLDNQNSTLVLVWVTFAGSLLMFFGATLFKRERPWGKNETISSILLVVVRAIKKPESENIPFWLLFALASITTLLSTKGGSAKDYIFAIYFCIFDSTLTVLALRKYLHKKLSLVE